MASTTPAADIHIWAASAHSRSKPRWLNEIGDRHKTVTSPATENGRIEWLDGTSDSEAPSYIHVDDIRELVENPMPTTVPAGMDAETPLMLQMNARILCIKSETGFITSDSPVDQRVEQRHRGGNACLGQRLATLEDIEYRTVQGEHDRQVGVAREDQNIALLHGEKRWYFDDRNSWSAPHYRRATV